MSRSIPTYGANLRQQLSQFLALGGDVRPLRRHGHSLAVHPAVPDERVVFHSARKDAPRALTKLLRRVVVAVGVSAGGALSGCGGSAAPVDDPRVSQLQAQVERLEKEIASSRSEAEHQRRVGGFWMVVALTSIGASVASAAWVSAKRRTSTGDVLGASDGGAA